MTTLEPHPVDLSTDAVLEREFEGLAITASGLDRRGPTLVAVDRYISPEWAARENERVWPKVWQIACSVDHVAEPGDYYEYRAGWLSILVVRGSDGQLRAFQNTCRHRGNALCQGTGAGLTELRCPYHRWAWTTEGRLREVPSRKGFGVLDNDEYALIPAQVDTWGRMVFVNADIDAMPLSEWLEGIPTDVATFCPVDDYRCQHLIVSNMPANWKVVAEGFSETYHIQGIHREMLGHIDDIDARQRLWYRHGVSYQQYGVPSPRVRNATDESVWSSWMVCQGGRMGLGPDAPLPPLAEGETAQDAIAAAMASHYAEKGVDLSGYDTAGLTALHQYNLFPNATVLVMPDMVSVLSSRPGLTADECQFVMMTFHRSAPDAPRAEPMTMEVPDRTDFGFVMNQDVGIMRTAQLGLHQPGLKHITLSAEECRAINLHRNLDEWVTGVRS